MFVAIVVTAVLSIGLYALVVLAERLTIPWWRASRANPVRDRAPEGEPE